jgi:hypothetical protein
MSTSERSGIAISPREMPGIFGMAAAIGCGWRPSRHPFGGLCFGPATTYLPDPCGWLRSEDKVWRRQALPEERIVASLGGTTKGMSSSGRTSPQRSEAAASAPSNALYPGMKWCSARGAYESWLTSLHCIVHMSAYNVDSDVLCLSKKLSEVTHHLPRCLRKVCMPQVA